VRKEEVGTTFDKHNIWLLRAWRKISFHEKFGSMAARDEFRGSVFHFAGDVETETFEDRCIAVSRIVYKTDCPNPERHAALRRESR